MAAHQLAPLAMAGLFLPAPAQKDSPWPHTAHGRAVAIPVTGSVAGTRTRVLGRPSLPLHRRPETD